MRLRGRRARLVENTHIHFMISRKPSEGSRNSLVIGTGTATVLGTGAGAGAGTGGR